MTPEQMVEKLKAAHGSQGGKMEKIDWAGLLTKIKALTPAALALFELVINLLTTPTPGPTPAQT